MRVVCVEWNQVNEWLDPNIDPGILAGSSGNSTEGLSRCKALAYMSGSSPAREFQIFGEMCADVLSVSTRIFE